MKSLSICFLMLVLGTFSICSISARAQQEVDPDHFDQPSAFSKHVRGRTRKAITPQRPRNAGATGNGLMHIRTNPVRKKWR